MFQWFKERIKKELPIPIVQKPIIITIHGYGRRRMHEFDNLALWGKKDDFEIIQFDMYDLFDVNDCNWKSWVKKAKDTVDAYRKSEREIYLVGFSMGGVIASYLASVCRIDKLVLLAPAFSYINVDTITEVITKSATKLWSNEKKEEVEIPISFYVAFTELVKNLKKYIQDVSCPVLMMHGDEDEVISMRSSYWGYDKITHEHKKLIILHKGHHRLLMDETVNWECYQIIRLFFNNAILNKEPIEQSEDVMERLLQQKRELDSQKDSVVME